MSLKRQIFWGYGLLLLTMAVAIAWSIWHLVELSNAASEILHENYRSITAAEKIISSIERQDRAVLLALLGNSTEGKKQFFENELTISKWLERAKDNVTVPGESEVLARIEAGYSDFRIACQDFFSKLEKPEPERLILGAVYKKELMALFLDVRASCEKLRTMNETTMYEASQRAWFVGRNAIWSTSVVAILVLLISLIFGSMIIERIVRPLRSMVVASRKIAAGDYDIQITQEQGSAAEISLLADEFNLMSGELKKFNDLNFEKILAEKLKIEAVLASIEDGLVVLSQDLKVSGINSAARRILGLEFFDCLNVDGKMVLPAKICDQLVNRNQVFKEKPVADPEKNILSVKQGDKEFHYLFSLSSIRQSDSESSGFLIFFKDVTKFRELEQLKNDFISAASHELRTPLTSIKMSLMLIKEKIEGKLELKEKELLDIADEEISRLKALIDDLLDLSKIEAGKIDMEFSVINFKLLIDHALKVFGSQFEMKKISVESVVDGDLSCVKVDANKVAWVLTNLISNALRYVPENGKITLSARKNGRFLTCEVADNGPGIPIEFQTKIFQKFVRIGKGATDGTGLGLAICKEIVRAHGGTIWVESTPGNGSRFIFSVPAIEERGNENEVDFNN
ncbi:MAG: HAMP domain-containing sensor histidine kinase [Candidatus Rifleibacteriota bacterium]